MKEKSQHAKWNRFLRKTNKFVISSEITITTGFTKRFKFSNSVNFSRSFPANYRKKNIKEQHHIVKQKSTDANIHLCEDGMYSFIHNPEKVTRIYLKANKQHMQITQSH